ncbi:MAG: helix-turn-helix domain-containing protein [Bacteroidota bacterium]
MFQKRQAYQQPTFWLFIGCLVSMILFALGDDDYNLLVSPSSWYFFHEPLLITFFFLFIRYSDTKRKTFQQSDALFFLPYLLYILIEMLSDRSALADYLVLEVMETLIELVFLGMLLYSSYDIVKNEKERWLLAFILPFTLIFLLDSLSPLFLASQESFWAVDSYGAFLVVIFLFYYVTYRLIAAPKEILATADAKYKSSSLSEAAIESTIQALHQLMQEEQLFKNQKLTADEVAAQLGITRQQLSEVLNVHMGMRFQDLLNQYRVEAFIDCLHQEHYQQYTLLGIAMEVGFSSKSSFNATFKKLKGITPSQYKKSQT